MSTTAPRRNVVYPLGIVPQTNYPRSPGNYHRPTSPRMTGPSALVHWHATLGMSVVGLTSCAPSQFMVVTSSRMFALISLCIEIRRDLSADFISSFPKVSRVCGCYVLPGNLGIGGRSNSADLPRPECTATVPCRIIWRQVWLARLRCCVPGTGRKGSPLAH